MTKKKSALTKPKESLDDKLLREMNTHPEKLTTYANFSRYVINTHSLDYTVEALRYHVKNVAAANNIRFGADIAQSVDQDLDKFRTKVGDRGLQRSYDNLKARYISVQEQMDDLLDLDGITLKALKVPRSKEDLRKQGVPIIQWSDWHVEKRIDLEETNGLNEYNPEIAKQRAMTLFDNTLKMVDLHRKHVEITQGVLHLGGDVIEGYLREHNLRENYMTPMEATIFGSELEITGIESLLSSGFFDTLFVLMNRGNHSRTTKKMDSDDYRVNYETLVHYNVIKHFRNNPKVQFVAPQGDIGYFDIMGKTLRFFHGHQVQFGGGVGGLAIPLRKAIMNWDETTKADENLMGHFHTSYKPLANVMENGSLCGYDWYAQSIVKAQYQPPLQSMEMLLEDKGFRMFTSIDCE